MRRLLIGLGALLLSATTAATVSASSAAASTATTACRPDAESPSCYVWTGKVAWVADGDTPLVDVYGDGTSTPVSVRLLGVQSMEQSVYNPVVAKRRGECHALAATARVEQLVKAGGGVVRMTSQQASSSNRNRPLRSIAVKLKGAWYDIGLDLIRNGYVLWMPDRAEWAWNETYRLAAQQASRAGRQLYDTDTCGVGPDQATRLSLTVNYDAPGNDATNLNGEWFQIHNGSPRAMSLAGWWVRDSALRRYTFPQGTAVPAHGSVYVHAGSGRATATHKYWGQKTAVFDNPTVDHTAMGDGGYLFDPRGDLRSWMLYPTI